MGRFLSCSAEQSNRQTDRQTDPHHVRLCSQNNVWWFSSLSAIRLSSVTDTENLQLNVWVRLYESLTCVPGLTSTTGWSPSRNHRAVVLRSGLAPAPPPPCHGLWGVRLVSVWPGSSSRTPCSCKVSPRCGSACVSSGPRPAWSPSRSTDTGSVAPCYGSGHACPVSVSEWNPFHRGCRRMPALLCESSGASSDCLSGWRPSHRSCSCKVSLRCGSSGASAVPPEPGNSFRTHRRCFRSRGGSAGEQRGCRRTRTGVHRVHSSSLGPAGESPRVLPGGSSCRRHSCTLCSGGAVLSRGVSSACQCRHSDATPYVAADCGVCWTPDRRCCRCAPLPPHSAPACVALTTSCDRRCGCTLYI